MRQPVEEGLLLYHLMTNSLVLLNGDEAKLLDEDPSKVDGLVENWFAVPESHDDRKLALEVRAVGKMLRLRLDGHDIPSIACLLSEKYGVPKGQVALDAEALFTRLGVK